MKQNRYERIMELIEEKQISTQMELVQALTKEGYEVTQATVSRDIKRLSLSKEKDSDGKLYYCRPEILKKPGNKKYTEIMKNGFVSVQAAENILVIKTVSGMAMAVAAAMDHMDFPDIIGTIAGDDTIMCAVIGKHQAALLEKRMERMIASL